MARSRSWRAESLTGRAALIDLLSTPLRGGSALSFGRRAEIPDGNDPILDQTHLDSRPTGLSKL